MSDINKRAVEFAKINAKDHNVEVDIRWGNLYEPWEGMKFDMIVCNPPVVAGKKVWMEIVRKAPEFLEEGGSLQVVAYHNKGAEGSEISWRRFSGTWRNSARPVE